MRKAGSDNRFARGDRLDEHSRDHLIARAVWQQNHVGHPYPGEDGCGVDVTVVELDQVGDAKGAGTFLQRRSVGLALVLDDARVRPAVHDVAGSGLGSRGRRRAGSPSAARSDTVTKPPCGTTQTRAAETWCASSRHARAASLWTTTTSA